MYAGGESLPASVSLFILGLAGLALLGKGIAESSAILDLMGVAVLIVVLRYIVMAAGVRHRENLRRPKRNRR
jgi:hypothetical protein